MSTIYGCSSAYLRKLTAEHYEDETANDPRIDALRQRMIVVHDERYTSDYLDAEKRSIANAVQIHFSDGTVSEKLSVNIQLAIEEGVKKGCRK